MMTRYLHLVAATVLAMVAMVTEKASAQTPAAPQSAEANSTSVATPESPDGRGLPNAAGWKELEIRPEEKWVPAVFGGDGPVEIKDGVISLGFGDPLTGARWEGPFPRMNYEISLEARRTAGFDFFCGLTLPADDQRFSLILGGWGGSLVGISSIDGLDAANNETMMVREFEQNQWYKVRMEVTQDALRAWIDDKKIVDFERDARPLDIRAEMEQTAPVGIAAFQCQSEIRNVRVRRLDSAAQPAEGSP
jgi:hypothetical protein